MSILHSYAGQTQKPLWRFFTHREEALAGDDGSLVSGARGNVFYKYVNGIPQDVRTDFQLGLAHNVFRLWFGGICADHTIFFAAVFLEVQETSLVVSTKYKAYDDFLLISLCLRGDGEAWEALI